jgi:hypothetical protein
VTSVKLHNPQPGSSCQHARWFLDPEHHFLELQSIRTTGHQLYNTCTLDLGVICQVCCLGGVGVLCTSQSLLLRVTFVLRYVLYTSAASFVLAGSASGSSMQC